MLKHASEQDRLDRDQAERTQDVFLSRSALSRTCQPGKKLLALRLQRQWQRVWYLGPIADNESSAMSDLLISENDRKAVGDAAARVSKNIRH